MHTAPEHRQAGGASPDNPVCVYALEMLFSKLIHLRYHVWASQNAVKGNRYYRLSPHLTSEKTTSRNLRSTATEQRGQHGSHLPLCRAWPWLQPARTAGRFQRRGPLSSPGNRESGPGTYVISSVAANSAVHEAGHPFARALYTCGQEASTSQTVGKTVPDGLAQRTKPRPSVSLQGNGVLHPQYPSLPSSYIHRGEMFCA